MSATKYTFSIQNDFPNHKVATDRLLSEIRASAITTAADYINTSNDDCDVWFKDTLSSGDVTTLEGLVAAHSGDPLPNNEPVTVTTNRVTADGAPLFASRKPDSPKLTLVTPNWCDRTSWYPSSSYIADEVATDSGDHLIYTLAHQDVIDLYHGKVMSEDFLLDGLGRSFRVNVKVNSVVKTEQDPHLGTGGDYVINYGGGTITFLAVLQPGDVVEVTYHYAGSSIYVITPAVGKILVIDKVEVQFSEDISMSDTFLFQAYGLVDVFAPQLMEPPYNVPSGTKIPLGDPLAYKTLLDLLSDANHAYPLYPALGGNNWRALKKAACVFSWNYDVGATILHACHGMEIRVSLQHDAVCGGEFATATFYCTSEDET